MPCPSCGSYNEECPCHTQADRWARVYGASEWETPYFPLTDSELNDLWQSHLDRQAYDRAMLDYAYRSTPID